MSSRAGTFRAEGDSLREQGTGFDLRPDFDFLQPAVLENPYPVYRRLQERAPVFWSEQMDAWVLTKYQDVDAALRSPDLYSSKRVEKLVHRQADRQVARLPFRRVVRPLVRAIALRKLGGFVEVAGRFMWQLDPPEHTRLRRLMQQGFTNHMVARQRPRIEAHVDRLLARARQRGHMDFMHDFAMPLPALVVADIFGVPEHWQQLQHWENDLKLFLGARSGDPREGARRALDSVRAMKQFFLERIEERRRSPTDDLIGQLVAAEDDGYYLSDLELCANLMVTLGAAQVTTQDMLGNGLLAFLRNPEQWEVLRTQPKRMLPAVDEIVRYDGPVQLTNRVLTRDVELRGKRLRRGQMVYLIRGAANRDPEQFPDPDRFDIQRSTKGHVGFGAGIHYCLGALLARVEGEIAFSALMDGFSELRLADPAGIKWRADNLQFRGLEHLPVACVQAPRRPHAPVQKESVR